MGDTVSAFPPDRSRGITAPWRRRSRTFLGNTGDAAINLPLGPGQHSDFQQVIIAQPPALTEEQIESLLVREFRQAKIYDDRLQIARAAAFRLYNGEPMGDEEPGRSQLILTEVKDTINAMMPTMMRVFAGADHPVEFLPRADGDDLEASQAQDYVQHVCFVENDGWRAIHDSVTDGFQLKSGWIRWWWDYQSDVKTQYYYSLLQPQLAAIITEPGVTALKVTQRVATPQERAGVLASPEAAAVQLSPNVPLSVFDAVITRKSPRNRPRLMAVPPEQVLIDADANGPQDPCLRFIGIWRIVTVSDLVAQGFPQALVESRITQLQQQTNRVTRRRDRLAAIVPRPNSADPAMRRVRYLECWMRFDYDGDGIAELHHMHAIGDYGFIVLAHEPAGHVPLACVRPYPVPHRAIGEATADRIGDIQRGMTRVFRNILDSMSESIHPRTVIQEGLVNVDDVMNTEMGAVIREKAPNAVRELQKPFIGPSALPILDAMTAMKESRTGVSRTSQGLTPEVLQSTTAIAVGAQIAASADRLELIVRTVAEGVRDLYEGVLSLLCEHQDRARMVLLRGRWVPIDPRAWIAGFNIVVRVGVGHGSLQERIQTLSALAAAQKEAIQTMGPNNPLCTLGQYRNALSDMANAAGIMNVGRYFNPLPTNFQMPPAPPAPPSADEIAAQAAVAKVQADAGADQAKEQTDRLTALLEDDRLRDEARLKGIIDALDMQGKYGIPIPMHSIDAMMTRNPVSPVALALAAPPPAPPAAPPPGQMPGAGGGAPIAGAVPGGAPPTPGAGGAAPAGGAPPGQPPQIGLAQRLFLPPQLISALSAANRNATLPIGGGMPPAPAAPQPTARIGAAPGLL